ncbi:hypothetical protein AKJ51_01390 [candidate division MSBL1 archaeon SCGC-AAA382A20]|uniref:Uncharacterized protein n=1 Tax=candidate division MSBL1 archaeon SCGC-AAA382A20 TaxID=1698280 RepID=A0A133VLP7_9EURY|nr:hypothetical protein AKJ51_01390 [candidate division MSBL1 archaeon SCGC-AAA382A20]
MMNLSNEEKKEEIVRCLKDRGSLYSYEITKFLRKKGIEISTREVSQKCSYSDTIELDSSRRTRMTISWRLINE